MKWKWLDWLLIIGAILMVLGLGMAMRQSEADKPKMELIKANSAKQNDKVLSVTQVISKVVIDVSGEVVKPGVYELTNDKRIDDVLVACGGLGVKADRDWVAKNINKAEKLKDGMKIYIPKIGEAATNVKFLISNENTSKSKIININTALKEELEKLTGIGPSMAQKIIDYRDENGGFRSIEEIQLVPGIGEKMFEKIKENIEI